MATAPAVPSMSAALGLTPRARAELESEIQALRAQVIALGGNPVGCESISSCTDDANNDDAIEQTCEFGELGDLDMLPKINTTELLASALDNTTRGSVVADHYNDDYVSEQHELKLSSDGTAKVWSTCPYCEADSKKSLGIGGNRCKVPRKENSLGMWCANECLLLQHLVAAVSLNLT